MATTTMGHSTPDISTSQTSNKALYWAIAAALAILLIFAFSANRTESTRVTPTDQVSAPVTTPDQRTPADIESAPAMDSTPANSVIIAPENTGTMRSPTTTGQEPGTSVSPEAPKGTVVR